MLPTREHASTPTHRLRHHCSLVSTSAGVAVLGMGLVMGLPTALAAPSAEAVDAINHRYADFGGASSLLDAWRASGVTTGPFGYPSAVTEVNGVSDAKFVGPAGTEMRRSDGAGLVTAPSALAASIPGFQAATPTAEGTAAVPTPTVTVNPPAANGPTVSGFKWWPLVIGLAVAALLAGLLALLGRRRRDRMRVPTARPPEVRRPQTPAPPRLVDTGRKVPAAPPAPVVAPKAPELPKLTDTNGEPVKTPDRPRPPSMEPPKPTVAATRQRFAEPPAPPKAAPPPSPPPRTVEVELGKTPPLVVNYDTDPAHDIGGIEVTYENNAVGDNQQSRKDKSYSDQVGHPGP